MAEKFKLNPITGKFDMVGDGSAEGITYTNAEKTIETIGGVKAGTSFDKATVEEVFNMLFYPERGPLISLSASDTNYNREIGDIIDVLTLTASTTKKSYPIKSVKLSDGQSIALPKAEGGSETFTVNNVGKNVSFTATVADEKGLSAKSSAINYAFRRPIYYGIIASNKTDDAAIRALTKVIPTADSGTITAAFGKFDSKHMIVAVAGTVSDILNPSGYKILPSFDTRFVVNVQCLDGQEVPYNVYISNPNKQDSYTCKITYTLN